jgi:hypothetical protein
MGRSCFLRLSTGFLSKVCGWISTKFGGVMSTLKAMVCEFRFGSHLFNIIPTLYDAQIQPTDFLLKKKKFIAQKIGGRIQKFPDWPPGARTENGTALCH